MLPRGILFDLDDTILAFDSVADLVWTEVCRTYYRDCELSDYKELFNSIIETRKWFWSDSKRNKKARQNLQETRREIVNFALEHIGIKNLLLSQKIADSYTDQRDNFISFLPGAEETLKSLRNNNVSLALMTNGEAEYQRNKVERFNLARYFDVILIEGEIGFGKPDSEVYRIALEKLKLEPDAVWAVGDNLEWDVWGPQQLGIFGIWNDYKNKGLPKFSKVVPDRIVNSIKELVEN